MSLFTALPSYKIEHADKTLDLSQPQVMGILNVTPDSFSDGGRYNDIDAALQRCEQMLHEGASIIDVGGESTRPHAPKVSTAEELQRVIGVVEAIRQQFGDAIWVSIDTSNPQVIAAAYEVGADIWNDVRALKREGAPAMAAKLDIPVMLMHMRGEPDTMDGLDSYTEVVSEVIAELQQRIDSAIAAGVKREKMIIDPGFGFAKNYQHHCELLRQLTSFQSLNLPLMFGISRKRFLGEVLNKSHIAAWQDHDKVARDPIGAAAALLAVQQGASIIRTHNVAMTTQTLALWQQLTHHVQ